MNPPPQWQTLASEMAVTRVTPVKPTAPWTLTRAQAERRGSADAAGLLEDSGAAGMSDAGGIGGQSDADGMGGQAGSGGIGGQAGMAGAGGMGGACTDHETFFADTLWPRKIEPTCLGCHATDGIAGNRRMTFLPMGSDRWWSHAEAGLTAVSTDFVDGRPLLTMKPTGQTPHTGGIVVQRNSEEYALLDEMAGRLNGALDACGHPVMMDPAPEATFDPGFRRLTRAQFTQSLADLHGGIWQDRCTHPAFGASGCDWPRASEAWMEHSPVRIGDSGVLFDGYTRMMATSPPPVNWAVGFVGSTKRSLESTSIRGPAV